MCTLFTVICIGVSYLTSFAARRGYDQTCEFDADMLGLQLATIGRCGGGWLVDCILYIYLVYSVYNIMLCIVFIDACLYVYKFRLLECR